MHTRGLVWVTACCLSVLGASCGSESDSSASPGDASNAFTDGGAGSGGSSAAGGTGGSSEQGGSGNAAGGSGGGILDAGDFDTAPPPSSIELTGTLRDFHDSHPDFEGTIGDDRGLVSFNLGSDGKPVYAGGNGTTTTSGEEAFNQWFNDVPDVNESMSYTIVLERQQGNVYTYDNQAFFPADALMFGNEGRVHNYHFTYEIRTKFHYVGGEVFKFTGDDDLFVFINGRLAIDLGGVHGAESEEASLDAMADTLEISVGNEYALDFFFAERHTTQSTFRIDTTIGTLTQPVN